jgi:hypothetical protein
MGATPERTSGEWPVFGQTGNSISKVRGVKISARFKKFSTPANGGNALIGVRTLPHAVLLAAPLRYTTARRGR